MLGAIPRGSKVEVPPFAFFRTPDYMVCGKLAGRLMRQAIAASNAERAFAGRDWRRIKREMRKAWKRTG